MRNDAIDDGQREVEWAWVGSAYARTPELGADGVLRIAGVIRERAQPRSPWRHWLPVSVGVAAAAAAFLLLRTGVVPRTAVPPAQVAASPAVSAPATTDASPAHRNAPAESLTTAPRATVRAVPGATASSASEPDRLVAVAPGAAVAVPATADTAQAPPRETTPASPLEQYLGPSQSARLASLVADAATHGIPASPLRSRALEGMAKGVDPVRAVDAAALLASGLTRARNALGASASAAELSAGAEALSAGASDSMVARVRAARAPLSAATALAVLADLAARGVPPADAALAVATLSRTQADDQSLQALDSGVAQDIAEGATPSAALARRAGGLPAPGHEPVPLTTPTPRPAPPPAGVPTP